MYFLEVEDFWLIMIYRAATIVGALLMVPGLYANTKFWFKTDQQTLLEEAASMLTQMDWLRVAWHKMVPMRWNKVWSVAFIPGWCLVFIMVWFIGGAFAPLGVYGILHTLKFGTKWKVFLQDLKRDSIIGYGIVIGHSRTTVSRPGNSRDSTKKFFVKVRYHVAPPNGIGYYTVLKSTESKACYLSYSLHGSVDLYVSPEIPRSCMIDSNSKDMIFQACLWNWCWDPLRLVIGLGSSLGLPYLIYQGSVPVLFFLAFGTVLMDPQIYILAENSFNEAKKSLLEKGEIEAIVDIVPNVIPRSDPSHLELATAKML